MKILYGVLNWQRDILTAKRSITKIPKDKNSEVLIVTDDKSKWAKTKFIKMDAVPSVAASKNIILKHAIDNKFDYCVIMEDDVIVKNNSIVQKYISMMKQFEINVAMNGYIKANTVLDNKPNPSVMARISQSGDELYINRYPCSAFMIFKSIFILENQ